jgi:hypothetical protein
MFLRFLRRSRHEQLLLLRASAWILFYSVRLRLPGASDAGWIARMAEHAAVPEAQGRATTCEMVWAITAAAAHLPGATCLVQSLAGRRLLHSAGYPARLRIGVRKNREFQAHAWIELDGEILLPAAGSANAYAQLPL